MKNLFQAPEVAKLKGELAVTQEVATRLYTARLIGKEKTLVLHGGGNCSLKSTATDLFGKERPSILVKASGFDLASLPPEGLTELWLEDLDPLCQLESMTDAVMAQELQRCAVKLDSAPPSIEALVHAWIPEKFVDHSHSDAILALSSHAKGKQLLKEVFGDSVVILDYAKAGFDLAKIVKELFAKPPANCKGLILMQHGLFTWGATAEESYAKMIELVTQAEASFIKPAQAESSGEEAQVKYLEILPTLRDAFYKSSGKKFLFKAIQDPETLSALSLKDAKGIFETPPLTPDHLIRTKPWPIFLNATNFDAVTSSIHEFQARYQAYFKAQEQGEESLFDMLPRQILIPNIGAIALGEDEKSLDINADILEQSIQTKALMHAQGFTFTPLAEKDLFSMEYRPLQLAKLKNQRAAKDLKGKVALICGAAGAIGSGITHELLESGALVAISDLEGQKLDDFSATFAEAYPNQVLSLPIDITSMDSIESGIKQIQMHWGAIDLLVLNAGLAHVSSLEEMDIERFQLLERVNIDGTLLLLKAFSKFFRIQGTGGDIVLVSTKNVPSPSAGFGAYSATKAAGHQLARIASLELAPHDVRVNMVNPDGVFSDAGGVKSGLWALVGPDRMKARGLDEQGLEEYYQNRNLLKTPVTARHVGKAVLYFATRQSPTTGVSLPVDGGLPDATPR